MSTFRSGIAACALAAGSFLLSAAPAFSELSWPEREASPGQAGPAPAHAAAVDRSQEAAALRKLSAAWWQWALSIPVAQNPLTDPNGRRCMVGQHGRTWFLAGSFGSDSVTRTCSIPEDRAIFFPVINSVNIDAPNICGQGPERTPVSQLRAASAGFIDGAANIAVELDGRRIARRPRVRSDVFSVALPERNLFDAPCASLGGVPAAVLAPAVDDGFYVLLGRLERGRHTLRIRAENPSQNFTLDVTYNLNIVPGSP